MWVNLHEVHVGDVRTHSHALVLLQHTDQIDTGVDHVELRGFLSDASLPTFALTLPCGLDCTLDHVPPPAWTGRDDDVVEHGVLAHPGWAHRVELYATPLSRHGVREVAVPDDTSITEVWELMLRRVLYYWSAPRIPLGDSGYTSTSVVRARLGVGSVEDP